MHYFTPERRRLGGALGTLLGVLALLWGLLPGAARAQSAPQLVKDINTTTTDHVSAYPRSLVVAGKTAYFTADHALYGRELWKTDGTAAGTTLVKDVYPGPFSSNPVSFAAMGSTLYFTAYDDVYELELWKSDGTAAGTAMVKEIIPVRYKSDIHSLTPFHGALLFAANDEVHGPELWKSDGTAAGTFRLKNFNPVNGGYPHHFTVMNDTLYLVADETIYNTYTTRPALWKSDGTSEGTVRVAALNGDNSDLINANGRLFYSTFNSEAQQNLRHVWLSDGTEAGTRKLASIPSDSAYTNGWNCLPATLPNGVIFFFNSDPGNSMSLWRSDGTTQGTSLVKTIAFTPSAPPYTTPTFYPQQILALNGAAYFFVADVDHGAELWKSDGTAAGTVMLKDIRPGPDSCNPRGMAIVGGNLYFMADDGVHGEELWKTDGTAAGTVMVKDINPAGTRNDSCAYSQLYSFGVVAEFNGKMLFVTDDGKRGFELWISDGTAAGTQLLKDVGVGSHSSLSYPVACGDRALYFGANDGVHGMELWRSDGRTASLVKDLWPGGQGGLLTSIDIPGMTAYTQTPFPHNMVCLNGSIYFCAADGTSRAGLYRCDSATGSVSTIKSGLSELLTLGKSGGSVIFSYMGTQNNLEIWGSDGTAAGTKLLQRFSPATPSYSSFYISGYDSPMAELNGCLYFGSNSTLQPGLFKSDGTAAGTTLVSNLSLTQAGYPSGYYATPSMIKATGAKLFMIASDRLWVSDGTSPGTRAISLSGAYIYDYSLEAMGGKAFFVNSNPAPNSSGAELWVSDGTAAGTRLLKDIWPGELGSTPDNLLAVNNRLFFTASDPAHGEELWISDGTAAGTRLVKDIAPGRAGSHPASLTRIGGSVLFSAFDPAHGNELWISDGTEAGTRLACEVNPGPTGSNPRNMTLLGDTVIFSALDAANLAQGYEPWAWRIGWMNAVRGWTLYSE